MQQFFFFCSRSRVTRVSLGTDFGGRVDSGQIIDFLDAGGNLIVAADYGLGDAVRLIGRECGRRFNLLMRSSVLLIILFHVTCAGVFFDTSDTKVLDHLNYDARDVDGDHSVIIADNFNKAATVVRFFFFLFLVCAVKFFPRTASRRGGPLSRGLPYCVRYSVMSRIMHRYCSMASDTTSTTCKILFFTVSSQHLAPPTPQTRRCVCLCKPQLYDISTNNISLVFSRFLRLLFFSFPVVIIR